MNLAALPGALSSHAVPCRVLGPKSAAVQRPRQRQRTALAAAQSREAKEPESQAVAGDGGRRDDLGVASGLGRFATAAAACGVLLLAPELPAHARLEGVNKPELLPSEFTRVIDTGGFLSAGQVRRLSDDLARLEEDTGFKLRVLSQSYPNTPGLAIRDYWGVDDDTIVFVADPTFKNILNFNVGAGVDLRVPRSFWTRLAGKYGNLFYWRENGEDAAIESAVVAIDACLREEVGPRQCADIK